MNLKNMLLKFFHEYSGHAFSFVVVLLFSLTCGKIYHYIYCIDCDGGCHENDRNT